VAQVRRVRTRPTENSDTHRCVDGTSTHFLDIKKKKNIPSRGASLANGQRTEGCSPPIE
jgi:hypothetical protein